MKKESKTELCVSEIFKIAVFPNSHLCMPVEYVGPFCEKTPLHMSGNVPNTPLDVSILVNLYLDIYRVNTGSLNKIETFYF